MTYFLWYEFKWQSAGLLSVSCDYDTIISSSIFFFLNKPLAFISLVWLAGSLMSLFWLALHYIQGKLTQRVLQRSVLFFVFFFPSALSFLIFHQAHLYFCSNVLSSLTLTFALDFKSFDSRFKVFFSHRKQLLKKRKWACCYFKMMSVWHSTPPVVGPVVVCYLRARGCCAVKATRSAAVNSDMGVWHDCRHGAR